jgi:hypothetical protein
MKGLFFILWVSLLSVQGSKGGLVENRVTSPNNEK